MTTAQKSYCYKCNATLGAVWYSRNGVSVCKTCHDIPEPFARCPAYTVTAAELRRIEHLTGLTSNGNARVLAIIDRIRGRGRA